MSKQDVRSRRNDNPNPGRPWYQGSVNSPDDLPADAEDGASLFCWSDGEVYTWDDMQREWLVYVGLPSSD